MREGRAHLNFSQWNIYGIEMSRLRMKAICEEVIEGNMSAGGGLYEMREYVPKLPTIIWKYTGAPCNGNTCPGWVGFDSNPNFSGSFVDGQTGLYVMNSDHTLWQYALPCRIKGGCWVPVDNNPETVGNVLAAEGTLYQVHTTGSIWQYNGTPWSGNICSGLDPAR